MSDDTYSIPVGIAHAAEQKPASVVPTILVRSYNFPESTECSSFYSLKISKKQVAAPEL